MGFKWKSVSRSISINKKYLIKQYGSYKRNDRTFYRNYHRELKNHKGLSFVDVLSLKIRQVEIKIGKEVSKAFYTHLTSQQSGV